jgi:signal transduction histidine kinase/DNA-binding response OmpR family regulator
LLVVGVFAFAVLSIGLVVYSQWLTSRGFEENASLIRLTQAVQQETATAHLWFEEALGGDASIDIGTDVHERLGNALRLIDAGLNGGDTIVGHIEPLASVRENLLDLKDSVTSFDNLVDVRWAGRDSTGIIGGAEDQAFDAVFAAILMQSRTIADQVDSFIDEDQSKVFAINAWTLVVLAALFAALAAFVIWNRRVTDAREVELEDLVRARTATLAAREAEARERSRDLARARDQARAASDAKSQFLANMSHEIRTPMNGVVGMASLLSRTELSEVQQEYVDTMHKSGLALLSIINAVLDYSKIEAGKITLDVGVFSIETVVNDALQLFSAEAARRDLVLTASIDADVPRLRGDYVRLGEVFSNLISNAIKFSEGGEITVGCLFSERQPEGEGRVELAFEVSDPGIGIAEEHLDNLFEHFSQADGSSTRSHGGTGLGLAICKELVLLMGGEIGVRSVIRQGSTFWFTVQLEVAEEDVVEESAQPEVASQESFASYSAQPVVAGRWSHVDKKVLVVDDNQVNLLVAQRMLEELGFEVDLAADGNEAIDAADRNDYAVILIDSQMPGMDGNEATRIIRRSEGEEEHTPIIALTANAMAPDREKAFAAGVDDYLSKPVFLEDLEVSLGRLLGGSDDTPIVVRAADVLPGGSVLDEGIVEELRSIDVPEGSDLFIDLASQFVYQMPEWLDEIESAASRGDTDTVKRLAHKLLGTCRQIGAERLARVCVDLESIDAIPEGSSVREVELLQEEFDTVHQALRDRYLS